MIMQVNQTHVLSKQDIQSRIGLGVRMVIVMDGLIPI